MKRVLVVCLGNICRSPIGEEMLRMHAKKNNLPLFVESAGTSGWHQGNPPDPRSREVMKRHGHNIDDQRSRPLTAPELQTFDYILAMDSQNLDDINTLQPGRAIVERFVPNTNVPDPYYGDGDGFERVYEMIDHAAKSWISRWSL